VADLNELRPFSYAVLCLVGQGGAGPHDIVRMMRLGRLYWTAAESHWYSEPKRLAQLGYLQAERRPGITRDRTHYTLTEKGLAALRAWVAEPASLPRIQSEPIVKVLAGDLVDDETVVRSLTALRKEIAEVSGLLDVAEANIAALPHRERQLRLVHSLGRRLLQAHSDWVDEVERTLGGGD
jgi:DNA-binding PadR family transcriptional regulator